MIYKIAIIGESWGAEEAKAQAPFIGASGQELTRMLSEAGIHRANCFLTTVFNVKPEPTNDVSNLCVDKSDPNASRDLPSLSTGKFIHIQYRQEVERLRTEMREVRPNVAVALGNTAVWALLSTTGISKIRGTVTGSNFIPSLKVLPTFHPAAVLRDWSLRAVTVLDLAKAKRESEFPEIRRPERTVYIEPSLKDMEWYYQKYLVNAVEISEDIESRGNQITCIGFAPSASISMTVPFIDERKPGNSYWPTLEEELLAWKWVRKVNALPCTKIFQNGLFDINFEWAGYGIPLKGSIEDTMLLHHALQPESEKGLGFLGSVYTNEGSWKLLNRKTTTIKRDA